MEVPSIFRVDYVMEYRHNVPFVIEPEEAPIWLAYVTHIAIVWGVPELS